MANIDELITEIQELQQAKKLLEKVWLEIGAYSVVLSKELRQEINRFFKFDDSA